MYASGVIQRCWIIQPLWLACCCDINVGIYDLYEYLGRQTRSSAYLQFLEFVMFSLMSGIIIG